MQEALHEKISNNPELEKKVLERVAILDRLKQCLISNLNVPYRAEEIDPDVPLFVSGIGLDSVDALEVVITVENEFGVQIPDGDVANVRNLNQIADFIQRHGATDG